MTPPRIEQVRTAQTKVTFGENFQVFLWASANFNQQRMAVVDFRFLRCLQIWSYNKICVSYSKVTYVIHRNLWGRKAQRLGKEAKLIMCINETQMHEDRESEEEKWS